MSQKSELKITELSQQDWAPWAQVYPECDSVEKFEAFYSDYSKQSESQKAKVLIVFSGTTPVGTVSVFNISEGVFRSALIEYMIREDYRKMGYGPKAVTLLEKYCFEELGLLKLFAYIAPTNEPSLRLIRSLGYTYLVRDESAYFFKNVPQAAEVFYKLAPAVLSVVK